MGGPSLTDINVIYPALLTPLVWLRNISMLLLVLMTNSLLEQMSQFTADKLSPEQLPKCWLYPASQPPHQAR